ncbi:MAG TPA: hypothetical protein VFP36_01730, partial [Usitatibacter sp.]|nr:hypothetical protein [Usitatibacter sp.]
MSAVRHPLQWISPAPLWARFAAPAAGTKTGDDDRFRPALLRFASDDFMDRLLAILARDPRSLAEALARPETWRSPAGEPPALLERKPVPRLAASLGRRKAALALRDSVKAVPRKATVTEQAQARELPLKLYQPAHQRYYLVASDLVCALAGFPQHALATGGKEHVGYVIRRLLKPLGAAATDAAVEHAFVKKPEGGAEWKALDGQALAEGEELLPLFPMSFADDAGHPRRLLAGLIPVGRREEYMSTGY